MQLVVCKIAKVEYGFGIHEVQEIVTRQYITKLPSMSPYMDGIMNLRGRIVPVMNLARRFGFEAQTDTADARLIVLNLNGDAQMAVVADEVTEVLTVESDMIKPPPGLERSGEKNCLTGIADIKGNLVLLLDINALMEKDVQELSGDILAMNGSAADAREMAFAAS